MNLDNQLLFFFSALGAFNSTLLCFYFLFFAKPKVPSNYFLGGLLGVLSIRIWKSLFFYFNPELSKIYLQIGLSACFFIGPFLFFYLLSKTSNDKNLKASILTLIALLIIVIGVGYTYPYEQHPELWGVFYKIINYQWLIFIIASSFLITDSIKKVFDKSLKINYNDVWILSVLVSITLIWVAYFTASYTSYLMGALSFTFTLYLSILLLFYQRKKNFTEKEKKEKYASHKIDKVEESTFLTKINELMISKKSYKNPNLTLTLLAKELQTTPHFLSQFLNDNLQKGFPLFINEYRIVEAKEMIKNAPQLKMEIIAEECGFNSKSTFYAAFKKVTNTTPAKYAKSLSS